MGIVIKETANRNSGYGSQALGLLINYAFTRLQLHQLYANINPDNAPSIALFTNFGFVCVGMKKDWNKKGNQYADEAMYQLIHQS